MLGSDAVTGSELFVFANVVLMAIVAGWLWFVVIPQAIDVRLTRRLGRCRRELYAVERRMPNTLGCQDVDAVDDFLEGCVSRRRPMGLAVAVSLLINWRRICADFATDPMHEVPPFRGLNQQDQVRISEIQEEALRLLFRRAFLGSALWFIVWPGLFVSERMFSSLDAGGAPGVDGATPRDSSGVEHLDPAWSLFAVEAAVVALDKAATPRQRILSGA